MSVMTIRTINCDGRNCHEWIYQRPEPASALRVLAHRDGWRRARIQRPGQPAFLGDLCPDCCRQPSGVVHADTSAFRNAAPAGAEGGEQRG